MKSKIQTNPWILKLNDELLGEYQYLKGALDKTAEYFPDHLVFDFDLYYREINGDLSKVPLM